MGKEAKKLISVWKNPLDFLLSDSDSEDESQDSSAEEVELLQGQQDEVTKDEDIMMMIKNEDSVVELIKTRPSQVDILRDQGLSEGTGTLDAEDR